MKKSVLITGNAGLLGARLADWTLKNHPEYEVVGIDNLFGGYAENVDDRVVFYKRERSTEKLTDIFDRHQFEYVFHVVHRWLFVYTYFLYFLTFLSLHRHI